MSQLNSLEQLQLDKLTSVQKKLVTTEKIFDIEKRENEKTFKLNQERFLVEQKERKEAIITAKNKIVPYKTEEKEAEQKQEQKPKKITSNIFFNALKGAGSALSIGSKLIPLIASAAPLVFNLPVLATIAAVTAGVIVAFNLGAFRGPAAKAETYPSEDLPPEPEAPPAAPPSTAPAPAPRQPPRGQQPAPRPRGKGGKVRPIALFAGHADAPYGDPSPGASMGDIRNDYQSWKPIGTPLTLEQYLTPITAQNLASKLNSKGIAASYYPPITPLSVSATGATSNWARGNELFKKGYNVIEIHYDAAQGSGAGFIPRRSSTLKQAGEDPVERALDQGYGKSYGRNWGRAGAALSRGVNLIEVEKINKSLDKAARSGPKAAGSAVQPFVNKIADTAARGIGGPDLNVRQQNQTVYVPVAQINNGKRGSQPNIGPQSPGNRRISKEYSRLIR